MDIKTTFYRSFGKGEEFPVFSELFIRVIDIHDTRPGYKPHVHHESQWYHCIHGVLTVCIGDKDYELHPGEGIVVPASAIRSLRYIKKPTQFIVGLFDKKSLQCNIINTQKTSINNQEQSQNIDALIKDIRHGAGKNHSLAIQARATLALISGASSLSEEPMKPGERLSSVELTRKAKSHLEKNLDKPLTQDDLANELNCSTIHLSRIFKKVTGQTLGSYFTRLRMKHAEHLLESTTMRIEDICPEIGMHSSSNFTKQFKKIHGMTPGKYRHLKQRKTLPKDSTASKE